MNAFVYVLPEKLKNGVFLPQGVPKAPFLLLLHSYSSTWIRPLPLYVGPPGPKGFGKAPFVNFGPASLENTGDIRTVSDSAISGLSPISYTIRENPNSTNLWQAAM